MTMRHMLVLMLLLPVLACARVSRSQAQGLVARYNRVVSDAYRTGNILLIDEVVGPNAIDGKRLTGLIGVRKDMGIALDAHLETLEVVGLDHVGDDLRVRTREQWRYRDVQVANGQQVGEASVDRYEMLYHFKRLKGVWMVEETRFTAEPQVGRKGAPWSMSVRDAHGLPAPGAKP
jgi:hypothetical protein